MTSPFRKEQLSPAMVERYGLNHKSITGRITTYALAIAFALILVFVAIQVTRPQVDFSLLTWKVLAADRVDVTFRVHAVDDTPITCTLRAQDQSRADVGYARVDVTPIDGSATVTYPLRTAIAAYTVEVLGCGDKPVQAPQFPEGVIPPSQPWRA
ncbi:MAG: DUF4307 domain-containing protein [Actinomycetota bacterium]|nr:DUF4307 domain-containing protein [Actinomycetota bacterium]MDP2287118.1 DUF4307 domain-containing protein [Actinomycetota bacterium]